MKLNKKVFIAFDHCVEHGPMTYKGLNLDPIHIVDIAKKGGADGIMMHIGALRYAIENGSVPKKLFKIVKLTAKTPFSSREIQTLVTGVREAMDIADAVAYTIYVGSPYEHEMMAALPGIKQECRDHKIPLMGFMYPRTKKRYRVDVVQYAARLGCELGFDFIKTYYTGSKETFSEVIETSFRPVFAAGGPPKAMDEAVQMARDVMGAGAAGLTIGRTIWMNPNPVAILKKIAKIVHG